MGVLSRWLHSATPLSKVFMAVAITSALVVGHRMYYAPYVRLKRYRQAEEWANMIVEQEERGEETNIAYVN